MCQVNAQAQSSGAIKCQSHLPEPLTHPMVISATFPGPQGCLCPVGCGHALEAGVKPQPM